MKTPDYRSFRTVYRCTRCGCLIVSDRWDTPCLNNCEQAAADASGEDVTPRGERGD